MQVGTTKDHGLYNKPSAAVHPGALAAGTLPHTYTSDLMSLAIWRWAALIVVGIMKREKLLRKI